MSSMVEFLKKLVSLKTVSLSPEKEEFEKAATLVLRELQALKFEAKTFSFKEEFPVVYACKDFGKEKTVAFVTHYDVVPAGEGWKTEPFVPVVKDGKLFARGASDAKAGIVAFVHAVKEILAEGKEPCYNIKFFCFGDEELGGKFGIRLLAKEKPELFDAHAFYILDCSTEGVEIGASGALSGKIVVRGKPGHSAYPFACVNALEKAVLIAQKLMEFGKKESKRVSKVAIAPKNPVSEKVWNRFSITVFHSGTKSNVIPGFAELAFNWRLIPEENLEKRKREFEEFFKEVRRETHADAELFFFSEHEGYIVKESNEFVQRLKRAVESVKGEKVRCICELGATDGNFIYSKFRKPVMGFGPIDSDANIHGANEFVRLSTLKQVKDVVRKFLCEE